jgi:hypothetical protein
MARVSANILEALDFLIPVLRQKFKDIADWRYEFVRGGGAATHKFIPPISNPDLT